MKARAGGSFPLFTVARVCVVTGAILLASTGCEQASEPPPETPKNAAPRPPDVTEVTMEVSSAAPPGEQLPPGEPAGPDGGAPMATGSDVADDPNIGGAQSDPAVAKAVAPIRPRLRACYKKAVAADPNVGGSAIFDATIGKDGKVVSARFAKRDGLNEEMVGCLLVAVKAMTFDANRKSQVVTFTFGSAPSPGDAGAPPATAVPGAAANQDAGAKP